ncbi:uncharacterized protein LOC110876205 [Helianthus annuus]|uniref:uncharacterized protein LOC110876205 n=1 Tax=Helianthus annuus TaxID=4232 RepID=UPI00165332E5|nr:uncharacterized protein LOC110876205 [Helianthus annuus]
MSDHFSVEEFSSLTNDRAWYNIIFVKVEFIWHDVDGKRLVVIFLDQHRQKIVAFVPQNLIHKYNDASLMGGFFSLNHFQIENLNYLECPKYQNYVLVWSEKKIVINEYTKLSSLTLTIPRGASLYPLVPSIIELKHDRRPQMDIVDVVGRIIEGKRDRCCFELSLQDKTGHTIQLFLSALKPSDVIRSIRAVQQRSIIYVSRLKLVHLPDINILKSTELRTITYEPDMVEARDM